MKDFRPNRTGFTLVVAMALAGCSFLDVRPDRTAPQEFRQALEDGQPAKPVPSRRYQPPPQAVADSLLPDVGAGRPSAELPVRREKRFDVAVMGADAREFFMGLVADSDYNVILHPDVKGSLTIDLKNVTLPEVLEAVREVYGYDFKRTPAGYIIYPAELMSRLFHVDYINFTRNGRSETRVSSGQSSQLTRGNGTNQITGNLGGTGTGGMGGSTGGAMGSTGSGSIVEADEIEPDCRSIRGEAQPSRGSGRTTLPVMPGSVVATTSVSHFWRELRQGLAMIVCEAPGADFIVNQQSGVINVRAFPKQLREVERFLDAVRRELNREVVLEAKILEVQLKDGFQAGIDWASVIRNGGNAMMTSLGGPIAATSTGALSNIGSALTVGVNMGDFSAFVELLETQGNVNTLSSPRISTLNNQKAVIKVGSDEFFVTDVSNTVIAGAGTSTQTPSIGLTPFFSGIALDVTPQIDDAGSIILHIHPSVTKVEDQIKQITVGNSDQTLPLAHSTVRESDSVVHARNGQIVVIGGLMQNVEDSTRQGVAWLSRLPVLGSLFRRGKGDFQKSELVILLKPTVIGSSADWDGVRSEIRDRYRRLDDESRREVLP